MKNKEVKSVFSSLEDFSSIPPPELWDKIEEQLEKPKKKRRAVIWWSVAASLVIGLSVPTVLYFNSFQDNSFEFYIKNNGDGVVLQKDLKSNNKDRNVNQKKKRNVKEMSLNNSQAISNASSKKVLVGFKNLSSNKNNLAVSNKEKSQSDALAVNKKRISVIYKSTLEIDKQTQTNISNSKNETAVSKGSNPVLASNTNKGSAVNTIAKSELDVDKLAQGDNSNIKNEVPVSNIILASNANTGTESNTSSKDSLSQIKNEVAELENTLLQFELDKTKEKTVPENIDKWSVQVFAGVMSSQNYNNQKALGNTVDSKHSNGYGVKTNYKLNKKWGVSTGFKINELGRKIAAVFYYEQQSYSVGSQIIISNETIPSANNQYNSSNDIEVVSITNNDQYLFASNANPNVNGFEKGNITQKLRYFEMPIEISYVLLSKKKTNINMNTGGFVGKLISNDLLLNGNSIGENNNVNEYVYGTLLSSTLQYEFFKKTKFFIEPGVNYYFNPLKNQSFNQFQWIFNFGLNVSF